MDKSSDGTFAAGIGVVLIFLAILGIIGACTDYYKEQNSEEYLGVSYSVVVNDHDGNKLYEESGWADGRFRYYSEDIVLKTEDGDWITIEGALNGRSRH